MNTPTLSQIIATLLGLATKQQMWTPYVGMNAFFEAAVFNVETERRTWVTTLHLPEDDDNLQDYCDKLSLTRKELVQVPIFNLVSYDATFTPCGSWYGYEWQCDHQRGKQRFARLHQDRWSLWERQSSGKSNEALWESDWTSSIATEEESYALNVMRFLSYVPFWIIENFGTYEAFAEAACADFAQYSPEWWHFKRGGGADLGGLYGEGLSHFVFCLQRRSRDEAPRSSSEITIMAPLDPRPFGEQMVAVMAFVNQ